MNIPIFVNEHMTESEQQRRTWLERIFSWPWRPWRRFKWVQVPSRTIYYSNGQHGMPRGFICHPEMAEALTRQANNGATP